MRVLIINKFLYPNGGSETYIFKLGEALEQHGHEVQYFGMEHEGRCVGNRVNAYTSDMDFHGGSKLSKLTYPIKTIYSKEAREKLRLVVFVSLGMYIADIEKSGELTKILHKGKIALFAYLIKIPISLIGGGSTSARCLTFQSFSCYSA